MVKVIWMSDLHFAAEGDVLGYDPRMRLAAAIDYINAHHADAIGCVISGDMVNHGTAAGYAGLAGFLGRLAMPYYPMVGNHDDRDLLADGLALPSGRQAGFVQYAVEVPGAVLLCLDSLIPGETAGEICATRLQWLAAQLAARPDVPAYVFLHHPPVRLGLPAQDPDNLRNGAELLGVLRQFPQVKQIFSGHVHRPCVAMAGGLPVTTMRSVLFQAPAPWPAWDWNSFAPAPEAPALGVLQIEGAEARLQYVEFCDAGFGRV